MLVFNLTGKKFEPMAPGTEPDGVTLLPLPEASKKAGKPQQVLIAAYVAKWGEIAPETDIGGKPLVDPMKRKSEVKSVALLLTPELRDRYVNEMLYPQLNEEMFNLFKHVCEQRGFSIYWRQLIPEQRFDAATGKASLILITTITGFGTIALRTGEYDGPEEAEFAGEDGVYTKQWDDRKGPPVWARVGVRRKGFSKPVYVTVQWNTYAPYTANAKGEAILDPFWEMLGSQQLAKCGLALALRTAFPEALSGIYVREEMQQAKNFQLENPTQPPESPAAAEEDSQVVEDEVSEEEFAELLERAAPENHRDTLMRTYKIKYAKFWKFDQLRFYRVVARDLRQMIRDKAA